MSNERVIQFLYELRGKTLQTYRQSYVGKRPAQERLGSAVVYGKVEVLLAVDPITVEIIRCALKAAANEMSAVLKKTAYNMMIYEVQDYCVSIARSRRPDDVAE